VLLGFNKQSQSLNEQQTRKQQPTTSEEQRTRTKRKTRAHDHQIHISTTVAKNKVKAIINLLQIATAEAVEVVRPALASVSESAER
jgi:hypothetical protein